MYEKGPYEKYMFLLFQKTYVFWNRKYKRSKKHMFFEKVYNMFFGKVYMFFEKVYYIFFKSIYFLRKAPSRTP